ncbi:MAG: hypothetical protein HY698_06925 [Deltaproteobacteria bacterium]|nr:hypothetical protein [Deltaproteobacteria bacterium]
MPAEAIHISAYLDSVGPAAHGVPGRLRSFLADPAKERAARLGAVLVDLPYFNRFPLAVARYFVNLPQAKSTWGAIFHRQAPALVGRSLLTLARDEGALRGSPEGELLLALALGYHSHVALDTQVHPLVNALARPRAAALGRPEMSEHHDVEKYQSIFFHEDRFGREFMGTSDLTRYISIDSALLMRLAPLINRALRVSLAREPKRAEWRRWARGYGQYGWTLGSALGRAFAPAEAKIEWRPRVYTAVDFPRHMEAATQRSRGYLDAAWSYVIGDADEAALGQVVLEGCIDDPPPENVLPLPDQPIATSPQSGERH